MNKLNRLLALILALVMACGLCLGAMAETTEAAEATEAVEAAEPAEAETAEAAAAEETADARMEGSMVYATSTFGQKFSPFFYTTAYDAELVDLTTLRLLAGDRGGAVINNGIEGEKINYNGTDYEYKGAGNVEVVQNDDGSVDYKLTMRDDIVFSDGTPATIDDVIFGVYVQCDPTYDGNATYYALPIEGIEEYRSGMESRGSKIFADGEGDGYVANDLYTEDQYKAFWDYYHGERMSYNVETYRKENDISQGIDRHFFVFLQNSAT